MIEIKDIKPINRGAMVASCTVYMTDSHVLFHEVLIMQKGSNRWVAPPSRKYEKDGETKYVQLITFDSADEKARFVDEVLSAYDAMQGSCPASSYDEPGLPF